MKYRFGNRGLAVFILWAILLSCSGKHVIVRSFDAEESVDVEIKKEGCALLRSILCDIHIEHIDERKWVKLLKNNSYIDQKNKGTIYRIPPLVFFHSVIRNTGREPLRVESVKLSYGNIVKTSMKLKEVKKYVKSPVYNIFNFKSILSRKRLLSENYCIDEIDYNRDTIDYRFNFIPPSDTLIRIVVFEWIPVEIRKFKIIFSVTRSGIKRNISFNFIRNEFRGYGKDFIRKRKKEQDDYID